ncbi:hypothetical protein MBLNU230_g6934t1 [Neophaeotheca triangularis]
MSGQQQPISYRTVPNRNKTQKWQQAKTYNYDGDDWGGYDEYDDGYGGQDEPPAPPQPPYAQSQSSRMPRANSFDAGDETSHFTGPQQNMYGETSPTRSIDSARRREFSNPAQVPAPLQTRASPAPTGERFPPRKSSLSSASSIPEPAPANDKTPATDKPLPFIRPSDIYKRMADEKEKERQSMESARPSMDSIQRDTTSPLTGRQSIDTSSSGRRLSLGPVNEVSKEAEEAPPVPPFQGRSSMSSERGQKEFQGFSVDNPALARALGAQVAASPPAEQASAPNTLLPEPHRQSNTSPTLPLVSRVSGFGMDFIRGDAPQSPSAVERPASQREDPTSEAWVERRTSSDDKSLHDQPGQKFRGAVDEAFEPKDGDHSVPDTPVSRDESQSLGDGSGVSRSNTDSTAGISPIMSRVPSAATAQQRQAERGATVPTITEEASPRTSRNGSRPTSIGTQHVFHKPSPSHSRNPSGEMPPPDRASWNTPSPNNSPARTPALEDAGSRRVSAPMAAETFPTLETPDVYDQGMEVPEANLHPSETPASQVDEVGTLQQSSAGNDLPRAGRGRSGTDYSKRESDLAEDINAVDNKGAYSPEAAEQEKENQREFLRLHTINSSQPGSPVTPGSGWGHKSPPGNSYGFPGFQRSTTPGSIPSGRESPAKSRVREIATKYNDIDDASRRNSAISTTSSKSSWSNFGGSRENLAQMPAPLSSKHSGIKEGTEDRDSSERSMSGSPDPMLPNYGNDGTVNDSRDITPTARPAPQTAPSFRPHLPGEWVSAAPTPAAEQPSERDGQEGIRQEDNIRTSPPTPRGMPYAGPDETIDITPTNKTSLNTGSNSQGESGNPLTSVKGAGEALGAALVSNMGLGHQTHDFASNEPPAPVEQPENTREPTGEYHGDSVRPLHLQRFESDTGTNVTSAASSVPPTPPAKDTPKMPSEYPADDSDERPVSGYFSQPVQLSPLRPGGTASRDSVGRLRPTVLPTVSTDTHASDVESDRLRKDIVRSLNPEERENIKRESILEELEDQDRTQDALDAPENARRVDEGEDPLPAAETRPIPTISTESTEDASETPQKPSMLDQRFSWENKSPNAGRLIDPKTLTTPSFAQDPNAIAPEQPYERPRSRQGLHIVNPNISDSDDEPETPVAVREPAAAESAMSSDALPVGTAAVVGAGAAGLASKASGERDRDDDGADDEAENMRQLDPAPIDVDDDVNDRTSHIPSYYGGALDSPGLQHTTSQQSSTAIGEDTGAPTPLPKDDDEPLTAAKNRQSSGGRIPPFREILAIKDYNQRIAAYDSTRTIFAEQDTGLSAWLTQMKENNADYDLHSPSDYKPSALPSSTLGRIAVGHKHSPSIMKYANRLGGNDGARRASAGVPAGQTPAQTSSGDTAGGQGHHAEHLQARGKDLMKSATVLGGKAGTSAKGWLAKGKSRLGGTRSASGPGADGKVSLASPAPSTPAQPSRPDRLFPPPSSSVPSNAPARSNTRTTKAPASTGTKPTTAAANIGVPDLRSDPRSEFPFRDVTPLAQTTRTPAHRTLSSTFSRLRQRSRSRSKSRSRSGTNTVPTAETIKDPETMPTVLSGSNDHESRPLAPGTEGWGDPGDDAPPMTPANKERAESSERLGVLPSPGGETLRASSVADPGSPRKDGKEEDGRLRAGSVVGSISENLISEQGGRDGVHQDKEAKGQGGVQGDKSNEVPTEQVQKQERTASEADESDTAALTVTPPVMSETSEQVTLPAEATPSASLPKGPPVSFERPVQKRQFSDRALLPSQTSHTQPSPATGAARMDENGGIFGTRGDNAIASRSNEAAEKDDAVSVVSAGQKSHDEAGEAGTSTAKRGSSRHSSVSSLEGPNILGQVPDQRRQSTVLAQGEALKTSRQGSPALAADEGRMPRSPTTNSRQGTPVRGQTPVRLHSFHQSPSSAASTAGGVRLPTEPSSLQGTPIRGQTLGRPYSYRQSPSPRPTSYMPLGTDIGGAPMQEDLQVGPPSRTPPPRLGPFNAPPAPTQNQPYEYQPRQQQQANYMQAPYYEAGLDQQGTNYGTSSFERVADPRQQDTEYQLPGVGPPENFSPQQRQKGMSGFWRSRDSSTPEPNVQMARVAPHHRDYTHYGSDLTQIVSNEPMQGTDVTDQQGSGAWDGYGRQIGRSQAEQNQGLPVGHTGDMQHPMFTQAPEQGFQPQETYHQEPQGSYQEPQMASPAATPSGLGQIPEGSPQDTDQQLSGPVDQAMVPTNLVQSAEPEKQPQTTPKKLSRPPPNAAAPKEPERKKSRLGRLSSIFGRSNSQARPKDSSPKRELSAPSKPTKLQKSMPQQERDAQVREHERLQEQRMRQFQYQQQQQQFRQQIRPNRKLNSYEAYEAARRQHIPDLRGNVSVAEDGPQPPLVTSPYQQPYSDPRGAMGSPVFQNPPQGSDYFGGRQAPQDPRGMSASPVYQSPPPQGYYGPGAPTAGYGQPAQWQQPQSMQQHRRMQSAGHSRDPQSPPVPIAFQPTEASYSGYAPPIGPPSSAQRMGPYPAQSPPPQASGFAYQRQHSFGSQGHPPRLAPMTSPSPPPPNFSPGSAHGMASIDSEVIRSPGPQNPNQQAPWPTQSPPDQQNSLQPQPQQQQQQQQQQAAYFAAPISSGSAVTSSSAIYPPQARRSYDQSRAYPSPPYSPQSANPNPQSPYIAPSAPPPQQQSRYYAKPQSPAHGGAQQPVYEGNGPRREEREEVPKMRGASYPGQEWAPGR